MLLVVRSFECDGQLFDAGETYSEDAVPADARKSAWRDGWLLTLPPGAEPEIARSFSASHAAAICETTSDQFLRAAGSLRIAPVSFFNDVAIYSPEAVARVATSFIDKVPA